MTDHLVTYKPVLLTTNQNNSIVSFWSSSAPRDGLSFGRNGGIDDGIQSCDKLDVAQTRQRSEPLAADGLSPDLGY